MYEAFHIIEGAFKQPAAATPRRARSSAAAPTIQDRYGLHTFRRGDLVQYQAKADEPTVQAVVYACSCAGAWIKPVPQLLGHACC